MGGSINPQALQAVASRLALLDNPLIHGDLIQFDMASKPIGRPLPKLPPVPTKQKPSPGGKGRWEK